jgi:signal peptidase I
MSVVANFFSFLKKHDILSLILIIVFVIVPIRLFVAQPFLVQGESMYPTFHDKEYLIVDQVTYRMHEPERGDVIVFRYPRHPETFYIKRIIGLPGETVSIQKGITSVTTQDGEQITLDESFVVNEDVSYNTSLTLSEEEYFVMGDNRPKSSDSRIWGALPRENIVGRAWLRLYPFNRLSVSPGAFTL